MTNAEQPEALRLAAWLNEGAWHKMTLGDVERAGRELRRLSQHEAANIEWMEKTAWLQPTIQPKELGKHRADILRDRIAALEAENAELRKIVSESAAALGTTAGASPECSFEFMKGVPGEIAGTVAELRAALVAIKNIPPGHAQLAPWQATGIAKAALKETP